MFWKKKSNIFNTVKFRTTLWYAILFVVSSMILLGVVYHTLKTGMIAETDKQLFSIAQKLEDCYLKGEEYDDPRELEEAIPDTILSIARETVKGLQIKHRRIERNQEHFWYEISGYSGQKSYNLSISSSGKVLEVEEKELKSRMKFLEDGFNRETYYQGANKIFFRLISPDGKILAQSTGKSWDKLARVSNYRRDIPLGIPVTVPVPSRHGIRIFEQKFFDGNILETGISLNAEEKLLKTYLSVFLGFLIVLLLTSSIVGWLIAKKTMKGVARVSQAAMVISHGDFSHRVELGKEGEEIESLVVAFNDMLAKIASLIFGLKEVSDNIAHDLRTPLTRIRGIVETTVNSKPQQMDYEIMAGEVVEECDRLIEMINTMLEITRTDAGTAELVIVDVDLGGLAKQAYDLFLPLAETKNIQFTVDIAPGKHFTNGDLSRLQRMVANLLDNALKYTQEGGKVELAIGVKDGQKQIIIRDNGPGIPLKEHKYIFDRFFRGDTSRSQIGNGLGLSLVQAIVKAHKGSINVQSELGSGAVFTITFPPVA
ncbi:MAG: ATP-binding protein [Lentisphaerota bacterium]